METRGEKSYFTTNTMSDLIYCVPGNDSKSEQPRLDHERGQLDHPASFKRVSRYIYTTLQDDVILFLGGWIDLKIKICTGN